MKIVVCVKQVPDTAAQVVVENGQVSWGDAPLVINPWDEFAVEAALQMAQEHGGTVTALSLGKEGETEALKHALAMGCKEAVLVSDPALASLDNVAAARVLAAAIQNIGDVDVVFFGRQAVDSDTGMLPAQVARVLGWPALTQSASVTVLDDGGVQVERDLGEGRQQVTAPLPAVISVTKDIGEPRYPSFMGIRKAARAQIPVWGLAELGLEAPAVVVSWPELMNPPKREVTTEMIEGDSPQEIAEKLADKLLAEKVL